MKSTLKKIALGLLGALIIIQFIRPQRNTAAGISQNDISHTMEVPVEVHQMFVKKCYDCHSNNTVYPWYANVQPVRWWLDSHVNEGKEHLNFSEFKTYNQKRATHKLEEIGEVLAEGEMPLKSYTFIHREALVTPEEVTKVNAWIVSLNIKELKN